MDTRQPAALHLQQERACAEGLVGAAPTGEEGCPGGEGVAAGMREAGVFEAGRCPCPFSESSLFFDAHVP